MFKKASYILTMLLIGATITIAIPSKSDRRPVQQVETPFDVEEIVEEVKQHYQPNFQEHDVKNHPWQDEFLIDTTIIYIPANYEQRVPSVAFDGTNYFVVWGEYELGVVVGTRVSPEGEVLDKPGIIITETYGEWDEDKPVVAFGENYLVVWTDYGDENIYGTRVSTNGIVLDTTPIAICTTSYDQLQPSVAFGISDFFVVWADYRSGEEYDIYGTRIATDGTILDPIGIPITTASNHQDEPAVYFGGANYFVAWTDRRSGTSTDIYGTRVDTSGRVFDTTGIQISMATTSEYRPAVTFGGSNYFIVWDDYRNGIDRDIYGARVDQSGAVLDTNGFDISTANDGQEHPSVTFDGTNFFSVWEDRREEDIHIYGARIDTTGIVLDPNGIKICTTSVEKYLPAVVFSATNYFVVWQDYRFDGEIFGARINLEGIVLDSAGILISIGVNRQSYPQIAFDGTNYFVVWRDLRINSDIFGARISQAGVILDLNGIPISATGISERYPSLAFDGTNYLVAWQTSSDIYGARVNLNGTIIDTIPIAISTALDNQEFPSVAFDGTNYLAVWQDERNISTRIDIYGTRVSPAGIVLDTNDIAISTAGANQESPTVAFDGTNYFVVWQDERYSIGNPDIYAARVSSSGLVLDTNGIAISTALRDQEDPAIAFDGTNYLIVWFDERLGRDIFGARVNQSGVVLDTNGIPISTAVGTQRYPTLTFDGANFLLAWRDYRSGYDYDIYGARVDTSGVVIDSFPVSTQVGYQTRPTIAHGIGNQALITYSGWTGTFQGRIYNTDRIWGTFAPPPGIEERNTLDAKHLTLEIYPNPFRKTTTIKYSMTKNGNVSLKVYDVGGRLVRNLYNDFQKSGVYTVNWNGTDDFGRKLPAGVYFYRLERKEGKTETKELIILR